MQNLLEGFFPAAGQTLNIPDPTSQKPIAKFGLSGIVKHALNTVESRLEEAIELARRDSKQSNPNYDSAVSFQLASDVLSFELGTPFPAISQISDPKHTKARFNTSLEDNKLESFACNVGVETTDFDLAPPQGNLELLNDYRTQKCLLESKVVTLKEHIERLEEKLHYGNYTLAAATKPLLNQIDQLQGQIFYEKELNSKLEDRFKRLVREQAEQSSQMAANLTLAKSNLAEKARLLAQDRLEIAKLQSGLDEYKHEQSCLKEQLELTKLATTDIKLTQLAAPTSNDPITVGRASHLLEQRQRLIEKTTDLARQLKDTKNALEASVKERNELVQRQDTLLELLGERTEEILELRADLVDIKEAYRNQIELLANQLAQKPN